ncbi:MAG: AAA family ATPase, partial [Propionicimonas sp.]
MYLKSLTLRGFKSFASTTTLRFEPGITCVVGPNGSGKSNVVDALSWVMGEQGAKTLRGGKMEDVIFAGTSGRAPLGRAEVLLTIDNTDGALPIDYTEVTISRTMFRTGGSEYAINGHAARLLDVQELLSDSGIGREMHVIVGQGQLDGILNATPETRRGFIEEAAGVLKHRKRKEKAERKLEATGTNLNRLADLLMELRRQLKPLGRQAEVARRASVIQANLRDARARLLADDYAAAAGTLAMDLAAEAELRERRRQVEDALAAARAAEQVAEAAAHSSLSELSVAQETWYALAGLAERVAATASIAAERLRNAESLGADDRPGRDPEAIDREAESARQAELLLETEVAGLGEALRAASELRQASDAAATEAERRFAAHQRAIADRREGLARLTGEVNTLHGRAESSGAEIERLRRARAEAAGRAAEARRSFAALETRLASLSAGEAGLDAAYESAEAEVAGIEAAREELRAAETQFNASKAALAARVDALGLGLERKDASAALLAATDRLDGLLGSVATLVSVEPGSEAAISAALGTAADAVAVTGLDAALGAFEHLRGGDLGRAGLLLGGGDAVDDSTWPELPVAARYARDLVECAADLRPSLDRLLFKVAVVDTMHQARDLVGALPDLTAVTRGGDVLSAWYAAGGSQAQPSLIQVQAAWEEAAAALAQVEAEWERVRFRVAEQDSRLATARQHAEAALSRLHESDAAHAGLAEEAGDLNQVIRSSQSEVGRLDQAIATAEDVRVRAAEGLAELQSRLDLAREQSALSEADPAERNRCAAEARAARSCRRYRRCRRGRRPAGRPAPQGRM